jgi:outer membrane protein assembly factor BamB
MTMRRTALLTFVALVIAATSAAADWPVFRGNALQNGVVEAKLPDQLDVLWKFSTKDAIEGAPAIVDGVVYVGSFDDHLYAIDLKTGEQKWKTKLGPIKASPSVKDGKVYAGDVEGKFYCVDAAKGEKLWTFETGGEIASGCNFAGDRILIGSHDETLYCLDMKGNKIWDFKTQGPVNGAPVVAGGKTFVAGCDSNLHVIDIKSGKEDFSIDLGGQAGATAAVRGDGVYVGTMNNQVLGIDLVNRKIDWTFEAPKRKQPFYASAAVTDSLVLVGSRDKKVYAIDRKKGDAVWEWATDGRVDCSPVVVGSRVYFGSLDKNFYVINLKDGSKAQEIELDSGVLGSPAVGGGCVVVGTEKGTIYCLGKK